MSAITRGMAGLLLLVGVTFSTSVGAITFPVAEPDDYTVASGNDLIEEAPGVLENDHDSAGGDLPPGATAVLDSDVTIGTLALAADGSFTYTYPVGFTGVDSFTYHVDDGGTPSNTTTVTITVSGCQGGPTGTITVCWDESSFFAELAANGYGTLFEGFEDDAAWGLSRYPAYPPPTNPSSVVSQGITWTPNYPSNGISTSAGSARTGSWGVYSNPHGDLSGGGTCNPAVPDEVCDGFVATGPGGNSLYAAGGWFVTNTPPAKLAFELTYADMSVQPIGFPTEALDSVFEFFGVIETAGFLALEAVELEGTVGQNIYIFGDDFTIADRVEADTVPPTVTRVDSFEDTGDGQIDNGEFTAVAITELYVQFSEEVQNPGLDTDPHDVTNPANYLLFDDNGDGFDTTGCAGGVAVGDNQIAVDAVTYTSGSQREAALFVNGDVALPAAAYRLLVCGSTSIKDWAGNPLDGDGNGTGGDDFALDFTVYVNQAPVADDQWVATPEDTAKPITLTASDPDSLPNPTLTYTIWSNPLHGDLTGTPPNVTYDPDPNYSGGDSFTFKAWDGANWSNTATVSITVEPVPDPPTANPDAWSVGVGGTLAVPAAGVLANDTDPDSGTLTAALEPATGPSHAASFILNADGSFDYTHDGSGNLADSFQYRASDGGLTSGPATVTITVLPAPNTWYVATTGSDLNLCTTAVAPCLTVQEAAGRAASGDTVQIAAGTYPVTSMVLGKDLALVGEGITTVLNGGGTGMSMGTTGGFGLSLANLALGDAL
jgi:hypothetical protein